MEHGEGSFTGAGGLELFRQWWRPEGEARVVLAIVHGFAEHSGRYGNVVEALVPKGYAVHGFDLRGYGRSPGKPGHIDSWSQFRDDVGAFLSVVAEQEKGVPRFLMGHSMGGLIVLDYVLRRPDGLVGTIVSGPGLEPAGVARPWLVAVAKVMSSIWPSLSLTVGLNAKAVSRDLAVVEAYANDPLHQTRGSVRWGTESLAVIEWIKAHAGDLRIPILIAHGEADLLALASGSQALFDAITFSDKELKIYPGGYHEPHNDLDREQVLADYSRWLEDRLSSSRTARPSSSGV